MNMVSAWADYRKMSAWAKRSEWEGGPSSYQIHVGFIVVLARERGGACREQDLECRLHARVTEVTCQLAPIPPPQHHVRMHLHLRTVAQPRDVAVQRCDFDLLVHRILIRLVGVRIPIKEVHLLERTDPREVRSGNPLITRKLRQHL